MPADFIAETDGSGRVAWVWRLGVGDRTARPVTNPASCLEERATAELSGAPSEAISDWYRRQPGLSRQARLLN